MDDTKRNSLLIVDDDTSNLLELIHILEPEYEIYTAKSGAAALKISVRSLPDLILLDVIMPDMSGFDVLVELKKSSRTETIPVIFITGVSEEDGESAGLAIGAVDYIRKPFNDAVVKLRVRHQIQIVNLRRSMEYATKAAEKASQTKSAFLANMSHEIRTPMNAILGVTEILIQHEKLPAEIEEGLEMIYNSCNLLLNIINDILDLSKIEAGKMSIIPSKYKVASMINDSVQLNIMRIGSKTIEFVLQVDENIPSELIGDEIRIKQILNNLLSNAFKYTDSGEVKLTVVSEPQTSEDSVTLVISVHDTGQGMTKEQVDKLFEEYSRFNQQNNVFVEGTGLGLAITQRLLHLMDGDIQVESEPGKGSIFTVRLPQKTIDAGVLGCEVANNLQRFRLNYATQKKREGVSRDPMPYGSVLIVDDVETNLYVAVGLMKLYKLQIDTVMSGREAIDKIKDGKVYDVIFMDHMMPELDGIETTKRLRDLEYTNPIVALTANAVAGQADLFLQNGFDDFISKPIDTRQLNVVLNKLIRDKQSPEVIEAARLQKTGAAANDENGVQPQMDSLLLESFIRDVQKAVVLLEELDQKAGWTENGEDLRKFTVTVHGMKSALRNIGELELSESAYKIEQASRGQDIGMITAAIPELLKKLRELIEKLMPKQTGDGAGENIADLRAKLLAVQEMCANYNRKGALNILTELKGCSKDTKAVLESITELVLQSEFEEAESAAAEYAAQLSLAGGESQASGPRFLERKIDGMDIAKGLERYDGDEDIYFKILRSYVASVRSMLSEIEIVNKDNLTDYKIKVHGIKGASYDIFAMQIGRGAEDLEKAAATGDFSYICRHNQAFIEAARQLIDNIEAILSDIASKNPKPKKDKPDSILLSKLAAACRTYDMDGVDKIMAEIEKYQYDSDDGLAEWLRENVDMMNFGQIAEKLS